MLGGLLLEIQVTENEQTKLALEDRRAILDALFHLSKWVIGTLFLLNGAAAVAVLGRPEINPLVASTVALFFVNGVMASVVSAVAFVAALLGGYIRVMHMLRPMKRPYFGALLVLQVATALILYGTGSKRRVFRGRHKSMEPDLFV